MTRALRRLRCLALVALALVAGCGGPADDTADQPDLGEALLALTQVPVGVACLRVTVTGATRRRIALVDLTAGASSIIPLSLLPTGEVGFDARAFAASCGLVGPQTPWTWFAAPALVFLTPGVAAPVTMKMYR